MLKDVRGKKIVLRFCAWSGYIHNINLSTQKQQFGNCLVLCLVLYLATILVKRLDSFLGFIWIYWSIILKGVSYIKSSGHGKSSKRHQNMKIFDFWGGIPNVCKCNLIGNFIVRICYWLILKVVFWLHDINL